MPGFLVAALVVDSGSGLCRDGISGFSRAVFLFVVVKPKDAPHPGRYVPEGQLPEAYGFRLQKTARRHPLRTAVADFHGPDCSADHSDSDVPVVQSYRFSRAGAEETPVFSQAAAR